MMKDVIKINQSCYHRGNARTWQDGYHLENNIQ